VFPRRQLRSRREQNRHEGRWCVPSPLAYRRLPKDFLRTHRDGDSLSNTGRVDGGWLSVVDVEEMDIISGVEGEKNTEGKAN